MGPSKIKVYFHACFQSFTIVNEVHGFIRLSLCLLQTMARVETRALIGGGGG